MIHSQFTNRPHAKAEKVQKESKVSMAGYQPHEEMIKSMIRAGKQLYDARTASYNAQEGVDIDEQVIDPTLRKDFDFLDAKIAVDNAKKHVKEVKIAREKLEKLEKENKKAAEEAAKGHTQPLDTSMAK